MKILVLTTSVEKQADADKIAEQLLEKHLAAFENLILKAAKKARVVNPSYPKGSLARGCPVTTGIWELW